MTTAIAAFAATSKPVAAVAAIAAAPSIAADGSRPLTESEIVLDDLWTRRREMAGQIQHLLAVCKATSDAAGATEATKDAAESAYDGAAHPILAAAIDIEDEIKSLPPSVNQAGALLLLSLQEFGGRETLEIACALKVEVEVVIRTLEALIPSLAGAIAADAADLLAHPDRAIIAAPFFT